VVDSGLLTGVSKFIQTAPLPINDPCLILMFLIINNIVSLYLYAIYGWRAF
jgi:hypothetical protein